MNSALVWITGMFVMAWQMPSAERIGLPKAKPTAKVRELCPSVVDTAYLANGKPWFGPKPFVQVPLRARCRKP